MTMKTLLFLFATLVPVSLVGQEAPSVMVRTLCFERDATGIDELTVVIPDQPAVSVKLPESFFSTNTKVPLQGGKVVFRNKANPSGPPIAIANVPEGMKSVFVIFFPVVDDKDKLAYRTTVMDASFNGIPEDGALVMNLYPKNVRMVVGEHRLELKPGGSQGVARPKDRNEYNMSPVVVLSQAPSEWKVATETLVRFPEGLRQLFISYPDRKTNRLALRALKVQSM
jgi:hypothetical protein